MENKLRELKTKLWKTKKLNIPKTTPKFTL